MINYLFLTLLFCSLTYSKTYLIKKNINQNTEKIISIKPFKKEVQERKLIKKIRESINEKVKTESTQYLEELVPENSLLEKEKEFLSREAISTIENYEVRALMKQGSDNNRIVLTFLGDGYTESEKEKFFLDTQYLVDELFNGETFKSYIKLFNVYAVFTPSTESGISDLKTKSTVFELYRSPRGSKRGIMPGNKNKIEAVLDSLDFNTDYPVIIANDQYYGGLGGRYAITTASRNSGAMVLRHELGHNFSNVGEEYDGGQVYSGANFSASKNLKWQHWISGSPQFHHAINIKNSYVWKNLNDYSFNLDFEVPSNHIFEAKLSMVGIEKNSDVKIQLNERDLDVKGLYTEDRSFYKSEMLSLASGSNNLKIINQSGTNNVLAYVKSYAYPATYNFSQSLIGGFNVFDQSGKKVGYRPTHNSCLMRDMREKVFCPVDQESIWIQFFGRINGIDSIEVKGQKVVLNLLDVGEFKIKWFKKKSWGRSEEITSLRGKESVSLSDLGSGKFIVEVEFTHPEIRKTHDNLFSTREFKL